MSLLSWLVPDSFIESVFDLDFKGLRAKGIRGLIFDLDNTIVRWGTNDVTDDLRNLFERALVLGLKITILSNNFKERSRKIAAELGVPAIGSAMKPSRRGYRKAISAMGLRPAEVAVIGDQLFTDVLGGKRTGAYTILVKPLWEKELLYTQFIRKIERIVLAGMKPKE